AALNAAGVQQYEISNFARPGFESRHNLKYWTRQPYLGFGVDAHSMLPALHGQGAESLRLATTGSFEQFFTSSELAVSPVSTAQALEESFFLGLRLNRGVDLDEIRKVFGAELNKFVPVSEEMVAEGLLSRRGGTLQLTPRGRLLSNEIFERFIVTT